MDSVLLKMILIDSCRTVDSQVRFRLLTFTTQYSLLFFALDVHVHLILQTINCK